MLEIVNYNKDEYEFPCLLVLGCFDGMHAGHAELLKKAKLQAKINGLDLGVMTFSEGKGGKQVYTFEERLKLLEQFNVKFVLKIDFNEEFKSTSPLDFLQVIEDKLNVKAYMSGKDFRFGAGAKGKSSTLKSYAEDEENGVWYMPVKDLTINDVKVGTSEIKKLLESGDLAQANELLGRNFSVYGTAEASESGAFSLKYPENKVDLKHGVYAVKCAVNGAEYIGAAEFNGALNICLENLGEDIIGKEVTVEFTGLNEASEQTAELAVAAEEPVEETPTVSETPAEVTEAVPETQVEVAEEEGVEEAHAEDEAFEEELEEEFTEETEDIPTEQTGEPATVEEAPATVEEKITEQQTEDAAVEEVPAEVEEMATEEKTVVEVVEEPQTAEEEISEEVSATNIEENDTVDGESQDGDGQGEDNQSTDDNQ